MAELDSPRRVPWSLAKKILLMVMIGVLGVAAAVLGNRTPSSDTLRG